MKHELAQPEPWSALSQWTSARIAMGRAGVSTPTRPLLEFNLDHARARDAIHTALDVDNLRLDFERAGFATLTVQSSVHDRAEYLRRPDLGASLESSSIKTLSLCENVTTGLLTVVVADGLSSLAPTSHALPVLERLRGGLVNWRLDDIVIATQARVALADEIGQLRKSEAVLILIGERPGLKSPDSLGAYLTYHPLKGRMDSERNCISNIRPAGLSYDNAVLKLLHLLTEARALGATGTALKDDSDNQFDRLPFEPPQTATTRSERLSGSSRRRRN